MSAEPKKLADKLKAAPTVTDASGKNVVLTDGNGNLSKMSMLAQKCQVLFGCPFCMSVDRTTVKTYSELVDYLSNQTWWSEFKDINTQDGSIVVISFRIGNDGLRGYLYYYALETVTFRAPINYRNLRPLMLEVEGYPPKFSNFSPT